MSNITTPSPPSPPTYCGKILGGSSSSVSIFGYPLPNTLSQDIEGLTGGYPYYISSEETLFDLTPIDIDEEVIVALFGDIYLNSGTSYRIEINWYRKRDNVKVYSIYFNNSPSSSGYWDYFGWIGWLSRETSALFGHWEEISENGNYKAEFSVRRISESTPYLYRTVNFNITGIPSTLLIPTEHISYTTFYWKGLVSNYFDTRTYIKVGITTQNFTNGQSSQPNSIIDAKYPPSISEGCAVWGQATGLTQGASYTIYGFAQAQNGLYYKMGNPVNITMLGSSTRPSNWNWWSDIQSGEDINISATEWNAFTDRIQAFREYKNLYPYGFSTISTGQDWDAWIANQAVNAIAGMNPPTSVSSLAVANVTEISAYFFNRLKDSLNSIT